MKHLKLDMDGKTLCGIVGGLPEGDVFWLCHEAAAIFADCPGCNPNPRRIGTPLSELSGRPGRPGYEEFKRIAASYGYD